MSPIGRRFDFSERTQFVVDTVRHHLVFSVPDTDVRPSVLSEADQAVIRKIGARSAVFVLLTPPNRAWAGLVAIYWSEPRELLSEEEHYFEVVAPHLAVALENRYLFRRTRDALKLTEALYTASTRLVTAAHDQDVLGAVFEHASANGAVQAGLHMITLDASGSPEWSELLAEIPVQQDNGQIGKLYYLPDYPFSWTWLTQATEPLFIEDLEQATHIDPRTLDELQKIGVRAAVFMPLRVTDSFYASLAIRWTVPTTFDDLERRFYAALVMQVAAALRTRLLSKQLRQMNNRLVKHSAELRDINAQLEAFTYSVSHDLRAPLRAVDGFARALHEEFGASLDTTAQHYIERIRANADHMNALITDLLALSRLGQHTLQLKQLQPADIARRAFSEIYLPKHQDSAVITIGDLPSCYADPTLLRQVFVNLLDNALKFTRPGAPPQIEVGCTTREDGQPVYFVRDHGIGFEMDYADRLFGVFQRLPNAKAFEGTGVGLAIVQRIIQLHNGQVWAHSAPNQGTTFYFTVGMRETGERDG
jgi:signal transduction histidine kinase